MTEADWSDGSPSVMVSLNGCAIAGDGPRGERARGTYSFLLLFNAYDHPVDFILPQATSQDLARAD